MDSANRACLLLISNKAEAFYELSQSRTAMVKALSSSGCLEFISTALREHRYQSCKHARSKSSRLLSNAQAKLCTLSPCSSDNWHSRPEAFSLQEQVGSTGAFPGHNGWLNWRPNVWRLL